MNGMGKAWFKHRTADAIKKIFTYPVPISLDWKEKSLERSQLEKGDSK
jgi:hypothetical protein